MFIIQVNTDNQIQGSSQLTQQVETAVRSGLGRFDEWLTRVEVHLSDENSSSKSGGNDKRCLMEARPAGLQPVSVSHEGGTWEQALAGAVKKMASLLDATAMRLSDAKRTR